MGKGNCGHCGKELKYFSGVAEVMLDPNKNLKIGCEARSPDTLCRSVSCEVHDLLNSLFGICMWWVANLNFSLLFNMVGIHHNQG